MDYSKKAQLELVEDRSFDVCAGQLEQVIRPREIISLSLHAPSRLVIGRENKVRAVLLARNDGSPILETRPIEGRNVSQISSPSDPIS